MPTAAQIRANQMAAQKKMAAEMAAAKASADAKVAKVQSALATTKPPVAPAKPSPEAMLSDKIKGAVQQYGDAKPLPPSLNPKPQVDQGYGNGIGYDGKPLYSDIRAGLNAAVGNQPNPTATTGAVRGNAFANATGPMVPVRGGGMAPASVATMMKKGGKVKSKSSYSSGGGVKSSASKRGDGIAQRGKTKGRMV